MATAGFNIFKPEVDQNSVDQSIASGDHPELPSQPCIDIQLKSTSVDVRRSGAPRYPLKLKNYSDLRPERLAVPRILVLVFVPAEVERWISHSEEELALRHCGYWVSLRGVPETTNTETVTVSIPRSALLPARKPDRVLRYMEKVRLGQTERGSFVLTVQTPVYPDPRGQLDLEPVVDEMWIPFERQVTLTLARALDSTRQATAEAASSGSSQGFLDAVEQGVSANLCDALAEMLGPAQTRSMSVRFSWSPTRPELTGAPTFVMFDQADAPILVAASRSPRASAAPTETEVEGSVTVLKRPSGLLGGEIIIATAIDGRPHSVLVELPASDYMNAIDAHKEDVTVRCRGELVRRAGRYLLPNPHDFELL